MEKLYPAADRDDLSVRDYYALAVTIALANTRDEPARIAGLIFTLADALVRARDRRPAPPNVEADR